MKLHQVPTGQEIVTWRAFLRANLLLEAYLDAGLQSEIGVTHSGFLVMTLLYEEGEEGLSMTDIAALTQFSRSRLSHLISRLEEDKYVVRRSSTFDRRSQIALLTLAGKKTVEIATPYYHSILRDLFLDRMTSQELNTIQKFMVSIVNNTGKMVNELDRDRPTREIAI